VGGGQGNAPSRLLRYGWAPGPHQLNPALSVCDKWRGRVGPAGVHISVNIWTFLKLKSTRNKFLEFPVISTSDIANSADTAAITISYLITHAGFLSGRRFSLTFLPSTSLPLFPCLPLLPANPLSLWDWVRTMEKAGAGSCESDDLSTINN